MQLSRTTYQAAGVPVITPSVALSPSSTSVRSSTLPFFKSDIESSSVLNFHSKLTVVPNSVDPIESNNLVDHRVVRNNIDNPLTATTTSIAASANNIISSRKSLISSCTSTSQSSVIKQIPSANYSPTYNTETQSSNKSLNKEAKKDTIAKKEDSQDNYTLPLSFQYILLDHNYVALPAALANIKFSVVDGCFKTPASLPKSTVLSRSGATFNLSPTAIGTAEQQDGRVNAANCSPSSNNFMNCPSLNKTTVVSSDSVITANNYKHLSSNQHSSTASVITFNKRSLTSTINLGNPNYRPSSVSPTNVSATICNFSCLTAASPRGTIVVKPTSPSTVTSPVLLGSSGGINNSESRQINNSSAVITTSATGTRLSVSSSSRAAKSEESDLSEDDRTLDPQGEETETAPEAEGECDNSVTRCICDFQHDDGYMISCDTCLVWQHVDCVVLDRSSIPEEYYCERCRPRPVDKERAVRIQKVKIENKLCVGADSDDSYSSDSSIESRKITNRKRGGKGRRTARRKARIAKDDREPKTKRNLATRKSRQSSASFSSPPASPTQQLDEAEKKKQLLLERKKMLLEKKQETKQRSIRKQALSSRRNQDKSKINDESVTKNINNRDSWDEESGPHNDDEISSVSNNSPTASGVQQLRQWIDSYEEAVTNHYSQELRSRLSAVKFNGLHSESKLPTALMSVAKCRVSLLSTGYKILLASGNLSPNQPIIELKGKYLWTGALSFKQANISQNSPHVFYYKLPKEDIEICVDCRTYGNDTRFVRRSCKPNAEFRYCIEKMSLHLYLVATSAIDKNTEILINHYSSETASLCACGFQKECQAHKVKYHSAQLNNKMSNKSAALMNTKENNRCHSSPHKADVISRINKRKHLRDQKEMRQSKKRKIAEKTKTRRYSRRKSSSSESDASSSHGSNHSSSDSSSDPDDEDSSSTDSSPIVHRLPTASYPKPSNSATLIRLPHPQPEEDDIEKSPPVSPTRPPSISSLNHQQSQPQLPQQQQQMSRQYNRNVTAVKQSSDSLPRREKQDKNEKQEKSEKTEKSEKQGKPEKQEKLPEKQEKSMEKQEKQEKQSRIRGKDVSLSLPTQNQQQANDHKMSREDRKLMAYIKAFERLEKKNTVQKGRGRRNRKSETDNGDSQDMHDLHDSKDKEDELSNSEFTSSPKVDFTMTAAAHVSSGNLSDDTYAQVGSNGNNNNINVERKSINELKIDNDLESVKRKKRENYDKTNLNKIWRKSVKIKNESEKNSIEQNEDVKSSSVMGKHIDSTDDEKDKSDNQTNDDCIIKKEHNVLTVGHVEIFDNRLPINYKETIVENHLPASEEIVCRNERNIRSNKTSTSKRISVYESRSGDTTDSEDQKHTEEMNDTLGKTRKLKNTFNNTSSSTVDHRAYIKHSSTELSSINKDTSMGETPKMISNERILSDDGENEEPVSLVNQDVKLAGTTDFVVNSKSNSDPPRSQGTIDQGKVLSDDESDKFKKEDNNNSDSNSVADGTELNNAVMMEDMTGNSKKMLNDSSDEEESTLRTKAQKVRKTAANRGRTKTGRRGSGSQGDEEKFSEGSLQDEIPTVRTTRAAARNKRMQTNFHDAIEQAYDLEKNRIGLRQRKGSLNEVRQVIDEKTMMEKLKRFRFKTDNEWSLDKEDTTNKTTVVNEVNSGNAKKRWLRQAISEEPQQNNDDRISPTGEYSGPFKKRRVYRESISSDQSSCSTPTNNQTQMQYGDEDDGCAVSQTSASTASILGHPAEVVNRQQNNLQNEWNSTINSVMEVAAKSNNIKQVVTSAAVLPVQEKQAPNVNNELPLQQTEDISALNDSYVINNKNLSELMLEPAKRKLSFVEYKQRKGSNSSSGDVKLNNLITALSTNNTDTSSTTTLNSSQNSISVSANVEKSPSSSSFSSSPSDDESTVNSQPSTTVTEVIGKATQLIARSILLENMANSSSGSTTVNTTISKSSGVINVTDKRRSSTSTSATVTTSDTFSVTAEGPSTPNMVQHRENLTERLRREFGLFVNDDEEGKSSAAVASKNQGAANSLSPIRIHVKTHVTESDNRNMLVTTCASVPQCTFIRPPPPALPPLQVPRFSPYPTTTVNYVKEQHSTQSPAVISPTHPVVIQQVNGGANRSAHPSSHITIVRGPRPPSSCSTTSSSSSTSTSTSPTSTSSRLIRIPAASHSVMLPSTSFGTQLNSVSTLPQHPSSRSSHSHATTLPPLLSQQSLALHPPLLSTLVTAPPPPPPPLPPLPPPLPPSS